jgi:hypothetical protein
MPAMQAYYFLKGQRAQFAGVVDGGRFVGLVHFESLHRATSTGSDSA